MTNRSVTLCHNPSHYVESWGTSVESEEVFHIVRFNLGKEVLIPQLIKQMSCLKCLSQSQLSHKIAHEIPIPSVDIYFHFLFVTLSSPFLGGFWKQMQN